MMTYCLGILLPTGLVLASDSRSNAGVDQVQQVCKLAVLAEPGKHVIAILSQGNLATTQSVVTRLRQAAGSGDVGHDLNLAKTMFDVAEIVGGALREVSDRDAKYVAPYGSADASFLVGGQIAGEPPRLFQIYSAGNFIEATRRSNFLQIGETKYGKPILDRALTCDSSLEHATKLALLSFDATVRSNLSVGLPIDLFRYQTDSLSAADLTTVDADNRYWR
jgi:putative proteasome-type protease